MSGLQWLFVIAAGVAGYLAVSFLIDRSRRTKSEPPPLQPNDSPAEDNRRVFNEVPLSRTGTSKSAWDELGGRGPPPP